MITIAGRVYSQDGIREISMMEYDLSKLWCADSITFTTREYDENNRVIYNEHHESSFPEPLGFIGNNYQRFYIHYTSVKKSTRDPSQYIVAGKTRVKDNICSFRGTITVLRAKLCITNKPKTPERRGSVICRYVYFEDSTRPHSGVITGTLKTDFYLDKENNIFYDDFEIVSDGYCNNQCSGYWESYIGHHRKVCNWGHFRIPKCGDLDIGAGDFSVNEKYISNGWQNYSAAFYGGNDTAKISRAREKEAEQWWK